LSPSFAEQGLTACGYSALTLMQEGCEVLSVEFKINLFSPARGDRLAVRGHVLRSGRTITCARGKSSRSARRVRPTARR
jgi:acyl-coenzyme A thioesterase PaaI-like protein